MKWKNKVIMGLIFMYFILLANHSYSLTVMPSDIHTSDDSKPLIVTTTTVLSSIVEDIAGGLVDVQYIVPPSLCPGHYDVKPSDVDLIRNASLILKHGLLFGERWFDELINMANQSGDLDVDIVDVGTDWNTPSAARQLYINVADALSSVLGIDVSTRLDKCLQAINETEERLIEISQNNSFEDTPVVVMEWQKNFVEFLGFDIVAVFGPSEKVSEEDIVEIEENATESGAKLVIDNLHSGVSLGERIAEDIGAVHVVLINFPGVVPEANNLTQMMLHNAKQLLDGLKYYDYKVQIQQLERKVDLWRWISIAFVILAIVEAIIIITFIRRRE